MVLSMKTLLLISLALLTLTPKAQAQELTDYGDALTALSPSIYYAHQNFPSYWGEAKAISPAKAQRAAQQVMALFAKISPALTATVSVILVHEIGDENVEAYADGEIIVIDDSFIKDALYHELIHALDYRASREGVDTTFPDWQQLNPTHFSYYGLEIGWQDARALWHPMRSSFITPYAMATVGEDRAEVGAAILQGRSKPKAGAIREKWHLMQRFLQQWGK